jgi:hypothetical protein
MLLTLRSAATPGRRRSCGTATSATTSKGWPTPCPGTDTISRATLLIAICAGVALDRMLLGHTELNSLSTENLIPYLRAALDAVANAREQAPGPTAR